MLRFAVLLLFIFRKKEKIYKMQSFIQYGTVSCLTPALPCDSVMETTWTSGMCWRLIMGTKKTSQETWGQMMLGQPVPKASQDMVGSKKINGPLSIGEAQVCANHEHSPIPQYLIPHQTTALQEMEWSFGVFLQGYSCSQGLIPDFLFIFESWILKAV